MKWPLVFPVLTSRCCGAIPVDYYIGANYVGLTPHLEALHAFIADVNPDINVEENSNLFGNRDYRLFS